MKKNLFVLFTLLYALIAIPQIVSAHTSLIEAKPSPNSELKQSPDLIELTFNDKVENTQFYIHIADSDGDKMDTGKADLSEDQTSLYLDLLQLDNGTYTVEFYVLSMDGHPISDTYLFTVKNDRTDKSPIGERSDNRKDNPSSGTDVPSPSEDQADSDAEKEASSSSTSHQHGNFIYWFLQTLYYLNLLLLSGFLFWRIVSDVTDIKETYNKGLSVLKSTFHFIVVGYGFVRLLFLVNVTSFADVQAIVFQTTVGNIWLLMITMSILGSLSLNTSKWISGVWVVIILIAEACYGHAITFEPLWYSLTFDFIHLAAASIWVSGICLLIIRKKVHGSYFTPFTKTFSDYALISLIILIISGVLLSLRFVPEVEYWFETTWGYVILIKTVLVLIVLVTGVFLRKAVLTRSNRRFNNKFEWDIALMISILFCASMLSSFSPSPETDTQETKETIEAKAEAPAHDRK